MSCERGYMKRHLVFTLAGPDRIGIVDHVTQKVLQYNGNIEESRMTRLGGDFAMIMLISLPAGGEKGLVGELTSLEEEGFQVFTRNTESGQTSRYRGWLPFRMVVSGADHEGIINSVTHHLAEKGINIETINTDSVMAPMSGTLLFSMEAIVLVPPHLTSHEWKDGLFTVGDRVNVDIDVFPYKG